MRAFVVGFACAQLNCAPSNAPVAQGLEHGTHNASVGGSIPSGRISKPRFRYTETGVFVFLHARRIGVLSDFGLPVILRQKLNVSSPTERALCPVCGSTDSRPLQILRDRLWSRAGTFQMVRCARCSHGFLEVRPTREGMGVYYDGLYDVGGLSIEERLQRSLLARLLNWRRLHALGTRRKFQKGARHLDVGCGVSSLLQQLAARGFCVVGLDFEEAACQSQRAFCSGQCVELWRGTLDEASAQNGEVVDFGREQFASASMIHYLEHTFSPVEDARRVFDLLQPGGAIVVEVPALESFNRRVFRSFWLPYLPPQHLSIFSRRSLKRALEDAGFEGVRVRGASAPFIGFSSFLIWWTWTLGRKSRLPSGVQSVLWPLAILPGLFMLLGELASFWLLAKSGRADHLRATAVKRAKN